jgi:hypothetical protein
MSDEVEKLIRLTLTVSPWKGREVREVVSYAANCSDSTVRGVAHRMALRGELITGAWALAILPAEGSSCRVDSAAWRLAVAESVYGSHQRPIAPPEDVQREELTDAVREMMGDDRDEQERGYRPWF